MLEKNDAEDWNIIYYGTQRAVGLNKLNKNMTAQMNKLNKKMETIIENQDSGKSKEICDVGDYFQPYTVS